MVDSVGDTGFRLVSGWSNNNQQVGGEFWVYVSLLLWLWVLIGWQSAPGWPPAYAELTKSLQLMGRGRELEVGQVVRMMKSRCNLTELCKQYPLASSTLQRSWDICDAAVSTNQCAWSIPFNESPWRLQTICQSDLSWLLDEDGWPILS